MSGRAAAFGMLLALAVLVSLGTATAGTRGNPETLDAAGDGLDRTTNAPVEAVAGANLDVVAAWIEDRGARFETHVRVADLGTDRFRTGTTTQVWEATFDAGGVTWTTRVTRGTSGAPTAELLAHDATLSGLPTPQASLDRDRDEVVASLPRSFEATRAGAPVTFSFGDGTALTNLHARALDGSGTGLTETRTLVDATSPGRPFVFGADLVQNANVLLRPESVVVEVHPNGQVAVAFAARGTAPLDLAADLRARLDRAGWQLEPPSPVLQLDAAGTGRTVFTVRAPLDAGPGDIAVLTVEGGAFPSSALVVVRGGDGTVARLVEPLPPVSGDRVVRPWPLHLHGATQARAAAGQTPLHPGALVAAEPDGAGRDRVVVSFAGTATRAPLGAWRTEPLAAPSNLTGTVRVEAGLTWTQLSGLRLVALVGPDPLPVHWTGTTTPPGTVRLEPFLSGAEESVTTPRLLVAQADVPGLRLDRGDRLAVALYLERASGTGEATLHLMRADAPTRLVARVEEAALPLAIPRVATGSGTAAFVAGLESPAGRAAFQDLRASVSEPAGTPRALAGALQLRDLRQGNATAGPAGERTFTGEFSAGGEARTAVHRFHVGAAAARVVVDLQGAHAADRANDNRFELEVWRLVRGGSCAFDGRDCVFVKASRSFGPVDRVVLPLETLERSGRGDHVAVVRFVQAAPSALATVGYTLRVVQTDAHTAPDAWLSASFLWSYAGSPAGDRTMTLTLDDRRGDPRRHEVTYRLTDVGPTLAPVADFAFEPAAPVSAQPVTFTDRSRDADGRLVRWSWDFGDGSAPATTANPVHAFPRPGTYLVRLSVTDDFNATTTSAPRSVVVGNAPPVAGFRVEPIVGIAGQPVRFADESRDPDGNVTARIWSFGDGQGSSERDPLHTYAAAGTYNVSLTVFDEPRSAAAGVRLERAYVVVEPGAPPPDRPVADFESPPNPVVGRPARFLDRSTWHEGTLERRWDLGDGTTSESRDPLHTYRSAGAYVVTLTVRPTGDATREASVTRTVVVGLPGELSGSFSVEPSAPTTGTLVTFRDASGMGPEFDRLWELGDGTSARGETITHAFRRPGTYTVRLTVTGPGATDLHATGVVTVLRGTAPSPAPPEAPTSGTLHHYRELYDLGLDHREVYPGTWRTNELSGALGPDYLDSRAGTAYVYGTFPRAASSARWEGAGVTATSFLGQTTTLLAGEVSHALGTAFARAPMPTSAALGNRPVDLSALATPPSGRDDLADGLLFAETALEGGGVRVARSLSVLEGMLHADVRTSMRGEPDVPMRLVTEAVLPAPRGGWLATWDGDAVRAMPVEAADNLTFDLGGYANRWFAVYDPATLDVSAVVVAGDVTSIHVFRHRSDVVLRIDHVGLGEIQAAEYLLAYRVADGGATRYAAAMELARQDAEEVGLAHLGPGRAAAVAWAGSGATFSIESTSGLRALWDRLHGTGATWSLHIEAPAEAAGKTMRVVLPGGVVERGGVELLLDGVPLAPLAYGAAADEDTLLLTVPVDRFSLRTLTVRTVVPGVPAAFLWLTLALGALAGAQTWMLVRRRGETSLEPVTPTTLASPERPAFDPDAERAKRALLAKLGGAPPVARTAPCAECGSTVRFEAGVAEVACAKCGARNARAA